MLFVLCGTAQENSSNGKAFSSASADSNELIDGAVFDRRVCKPSREGGVFLAVFERSGLLRGNNLQICVRRHPKSVVSQAESTERVRRKLVRR